MIKNDLKSDYIIIINFIFKNYLIQNNNSEEI